MPCRPSGMSIADFRRADDASAMCAVDQGDLTGALQAYQASLGIVERLAASDPGNADLAARSDREPLAACRIRIGGRFGSLAGGVGDRAGAAAKRPSRASGRLDSRRNPTAHRRAHRPGGGHGRLITVSSKSSHSLPGSGGAERDRTDDLDSANVALSQLSYGPTMAFF